MKHSYLLVFILWLGIFICACSARGSHKEVDSVPAFPGALGAGKFTTGGRGGEIILVTNLNDSGPGSLRHAVRKHGPRIIVFKVSGYIDLKSPLDVNNGDITIAGQTAPGGGICLRGYPLKIKGDNVIVRYLRVRPGDIAGEEMDAFTCTNNRNVIIDHCSFSWGSDEVCSVYDNENVTVQWCIISESMNHSVHHKGDHGYGGIWGGKTASFIGNLLAHNTSRNPRFQGSRYHKEPELERAELVNNVVYNWQFKCMYGGEAGHYSIINNYFKPGPATTKSAGRNFFEPYKPYGKYWISGNILFNNEGITAKNSLGVKVKDVEVASFLVESPFEISAYEPLNALDAYDEVLNHAGASLKRDSVDERIIHEVRTGTATYGHGGIIDSQTDVGGWPVIMETVAASDQDADGLPDDWEDANGLDKSDPSDASSFTLSEIYTNIELWMNGLLQD
ncbi:pectate lyase family protein [Thermophagus sp. OGC60D27]